MNVWMLGMCLMEGVGEMCKSVMLDGKRVRDAFSRFPSGVAAIAARCEGRLQVLVASSFTVGVSLDPPLAGVFVQKGSSTWRVLVRAPRLGVSILGAKHAAICRQLACRDKEVRFCGVPTRETPMGAVRIEGASVWFDCSVHALHDAGDHDAVQLLVHDFRIDEAVDPLVFHCSRFTHLMPPVQQASCAGGAP
ncbi:flavin reductase family protein [Vandammella animalimorsus]|nr:flavin reductase family protein [Vandammella animalimorsus]